MIRLLLSILIHFIFMHFLRTALYVNFVHLIKSVCFIRVVMTASLEYIDLFIKQNKFSQKPVRPLPFRPYHFLYSPELKYIQPARTVRSFVTWNS